MARLEARIIGLWPPPSNLRPVKTSSGANLIKRKPTEPRSQLRAVIADLLRTGYPTLPRTAARLDISPRSLQRQLERSGSTYTDSVDQVRHDIALSLLSETNLNIGEIAVMLGYRDPSSFSRAFKRLTKQSPRRFRAAHSKRGVSLSRSTEISVMP